jgi:hypothetical protein
LKARTAYYGLNSKWGQWVAAVNPPTGATQMDDNTPIAGARGVPAAMTANYLGIVFAHASEGTLRALSTTDGKCFRVSTAKRIQTVNARARVTRRSGLANRDRPLWAGCCVRRIRLQLDRAPVGNVMLAFGVE